MNSAHSPAVHSIPLLIRMYAAKGTAPCFLKGLQNTQQVISPLSLRLGLFGELLEDGSSGQNAVLCFSLGSRGSLRSPRPMCNIQVSQECGSLPEPLFLSHFQESPTKFLAASPLVLKETLICASAPLLIAGKPGGGGGLWPPHPTDSDSSCKIENFPVK